MKQKILFLCFAFLFPFRLSVQEKATVNHTDSDNGTYIFSKATLVASNFETKQEVENFTITDPALINSASFHFQNVFLQASIHDGVITECMLSDKKSYRVEESTLLPMKKEEEKQLSGDNTAKEEPRLLMPYNLTVANGTATIEFLYPFGDSGYNFPLEAKLTIILTKQETLR